jgi:hypothetical protein
MSSREPPAGDLPPGCMARRLRCTWYAVRTPCATISSAGFVLPLLSVHTFGVSVPANATESPSSSASNAAFAAALPHPALRAAVQLSAYQSINHVLPRYHGPQPPTLQ